MTARLAAALAAVVVCQGPEAAADGVMLVDRGVFTLGSDRDAPDEAPAHRLWLEQFYLDREKVTHRELAAFLDARGVRSPEGAWYYDTGHPDARIRRVRGADGRERWAVDPGYAGHPATAVTWFGARDYCRWRGWRLPTEAEWEKAARGDDERRYPWGDAPPTPARATFGRGRAETAPGGPAAGASPHGVLDLAGNLREWTSSQYRPYPYRADDGREGPEPTARRVARGGSHDDDAGELRVTVRRPYDRHDIARGHHDVGFRCATSEDLGGR